MEYMVLVVLALLGADGKIDTNSGLAAVGTKTTYKTEAACKPHIKQTADDAITMLKGRFPGKQFVHTEHCVTTDQAQAIIDTIVGDKKKTDDNKI